jgi:hypothetical protein
MGAAAIATRLPMPWPTRTRAVAATGLRFDRLGGPLVAVCGLVGGAGASTLAMAIAHKAATESATPVLLTEANGGGADMAALAGRAGPHSLLSLAGEVAQGGAPARTFIEIAPRLRLLASAPGRSPEVEASAVQALLRDARAAHGLVVVDCGSEPSRATAVLEVASHLVWAMPASQPALDRARVLFEGDNLPAPGRWREVLAAKAVGRAAGASVRDLRRLASLRCERLVLVPDSDALARADISLGATQIQSALAGLTATLRRAT